MQCRSRQVAHQPRQLSRDRIRKSRHRRRRRRHADYFLQEQDMTRYDAVNYISHGIAKRPGVSEARPVRGVDEETETKGNEDSKKKGEALETYCVNLNKKARDGKIDPV